MSGILLGTFVHKSLPDPISSGLVAQYLISDYSGSGTTLPDSSGNGRNATLSGSPTYNTDYFTFDGTNDYFISPDLDTALATETHTTECWVYFTAGGVITSYLGQASINTSYHHSAIEIVSNQPEFGLWNTGIQSTGPTGSLSTSTWYQITLTYDGSTCRGYVNGSLVGSVAVVWDSPYDGGPSEGSAFHIAFGATDVTNQGDGTYFNGRFGVTRIYNRALTAEELQENYQATKATYGL